eukprot:TRINITY_DN2246_c0_g1_i1.p1 TRINITY_DN2246_c0_g1~~TRINITY_DN2246_c0_g1_i1.p1  ORF type:complete len:175 (+),score=41.82 TRINITY_DN2246_c0_g1_i1:162-686(+)
MSDTAQETETENPTTENQEEGGDGVPKGEVVVETQGVTYVLKTVETKTGEEEEEVLLNVRAKLYRWDSDESWKERGTGDLRILKHPQTKKIRVLMRRDKILKICANHYISDKMELKPNVGNDKSWVYQVPADYADGEAKSELFAVRFTNVENATKFKQVFDEAKCQNEATEDPK